MYLSKEAKVEKLKLSSSDQNQIEAKMMNRSTEVERIFLTILVYFQDLGNLEISVFRDEILKDRYEISYETETKRDFFSTIKIKFIKLFVNKFIIFCY